MALKKQFTKYTLAAVSSACSDWAMFASLIWLGSPPLIAFGSARVAGGVVSFFINRHWSFKQSLEGACWRGHLVKFLELYVVSYLLSMGIYYTLTHWFSYNIFYMKLLTDLVIFIWNFIAMKFYVFPRTRAFVLRGVKLLKTG